MIGKGDGSAWLSLSVGSAKDGTEITIIQAATYGAILGAAPLVSSQRCQECFSNVDVSRTTARDGRRLFVLTCGSTQS